MGHKKRNLASRSKPSSPAAVAPSPASPTGGEFSQSELSAVEREEPKNSAIKQECERALTAFRRGNHTKSLRLIKEACQRHDKYALVHRCQATICVKVAGIMDDQNAKQRYMKSGIDSARRACTLSPNSMEFAHFYANLLYEAAQEGREYEEVVQECERALAIENPTDPAKDSFQEEQKIPTAEGRIASLQQELKSLIQKANIASISTWMKNFGNANGEEKFRLIPIRRPPEDPMELSFAQTKRPNEIKKATKTPEERRKEIEVRVAAARLLQQKADTQGESKPAELNSGGGGGSSNKSSDRRKHGSSRRNVSSSERKDQVMSFWNSMSCEKKRSLLRISLSDIKKHFSSFKDGLGLEVLSEALSYGELTRTWKFWACSCCEDKFIDGKSHVNHVVQDHTINPMPDVQKALPPGIDSEWVEMLVSCPWQPLDLTKSTRMIKPQLKFENADSEEKLYEGKGREESKDCWTDNYFADNAWDTVSEKPNFVDFCNGSSLESSENEKYVKFESMLGDENQALKVYSLPNSWPLSGDTECAKLLEKVSSMFQLLIRHKCLSVNLLQKVIQFTMDELRGLAPGSPLLICGIDQTPQCICFLHADQLKKIIKFLQEVSHACGVGRHPEKIGPDDTSIPHQLLELQDKLVLNEDASFLLLDESLLSNEDMIGEAGLTTDLGTHTNSTSDSLLSWIFAGPSTAEQLALWSHTKEERKQQAMELLQLLDKEFGLLQSMCERKYEHLGYAESLQGLEELCIEERNKRDHIMDFICSSYDSVLRNRREEIIAGDNDVINKFELDAINNILKEAENIKTSQYVYEETYAAGTSHLGDIESGEDEWKSKEYINQVDTCIEMAIQRQKELLSVELSKIDAKIMQNVSSIQQLEHKIESVSAYDYCSTLLPLVKSFLRAMLEDLAEKDATEKSDAAREAFLAELALDSKKTGGGSDHSKSTHEKLKEKKRNRGLRKTKDTKISSFSNLVDNVEPALSYGAASDGECADSEMLITDSDDELKKIEEDFRRKIELEEEERKLEETLEYQRRIENEAKQKHLAEQQRGFAHMGVTNNGFPENTSLMKRSSADGAATMLSSQRSQPVKSSQGPANGEIPHDDILSMKQVGRKGKGKGITKSPVPGHEVASSGKEYLKIGISPVDVREDKHDDTLSVWDGGSEALGQLHAEDDDEKRFQADLETALRQSLDTCQPHQKAPLASNLKTLQKISEPVDHTSPFEVMEENGSALDSCGTGLQNRVGEYNCFLNVIIQSLWHLREFRVKFLSRPTSDHTHVGDPCVVCALYDILSALTKPSSDGERAVSPACLRVALSNLYPENNFFQEGEMNDASEVLSVIFECLHQSVTSTPVTSGMGSWDCFDSACIAHSLFGMNIYERMNCFNCGLESRCLKYTSFFHNAMCPGIPLDELLNSVEMNHQLACDPEAGGCGKLNHIHHILSTPPHVFITVLGWQNTSEDVADIAATLSSLTTEMDISILYRGVDPKNMHRLVSVVCYYGQHYHCFAYSQDSKEWIMFDDKTVKVIGTWDDVIAKCESGRLQPQLLFFEAVN
ncbi:hypothetical protein V2J09_006782 [Rumex salicifolius]